MHLTPRVHAVILLTVSFGKAGRTDVKPLSPSEWAQFACWLDNEECAPELLLGKDAGSILARWSGRPAPAPGGSTITAERMESLLARGMALGVSLERWERAGLWALTRSDSSYPDRLKARLRRRAPAVLFGCGDWALFAKRGIAVVGSRNAAGDALGFAEHVGRLAADQAYSVVSGAARGVDEQAMLGALRRHGTVVGVLGDNLLRSATSRQYREHLAAGNLVLVSPFQPEAPFRAWQAMERNKYIYGLADAAVIACSERGRGGTWSGAIEALRAEWAPVWLKSDPTGGSGNTELARRGGRWLPDRLERLDILYRPEDSPEPAGASDSGSPEGNGRSEVGIAPTDREESSSLYHEFLKRLANRTAHEAISRKDIARQLELTDSQVAVWIRRGLDEGKLLKLNRPVRYRLSPLFANGP